MSVSPWYVGQTIPGWAPQLLSDKSTAQLLVPLDLTPLTGDGTKIKLHIQPVDSNGNFVGNEQDGTGTVTITDAPNGKFNYTHGSNDPYITTVGYYRMQWVVTFSGGPWKGDPFIVQTVAAP